MFVSFDPQSGRKATILACNGEKPDSDCEVTDYSKTCLKRPLKNRQNKGLNGKW